MKGLIGTILLIVLTNGVLLAQYGFITGTVTDRFGPLSDVNVNILNTAYGTYTNADGYFAFELDTGLYEINVSLSGYEPVVKIIAVHNLQQIEVDFQLRSNLMDADVSLGSKSHISQNQLESPVPIDVVYAKDLLNTGRPTLAEALHQLLPNFFSVRQSTAEGTDFVAPISLRGLEPDHVLVLVNGKRRHKSAFLHFNDVFGKGASGTDLNAIPIMAVDKIEVLRDGASSQYGSDAIAGVINIMLKEKVGAQLALQAGSSSRSDGQLRMLSVNHGFPIRQRGYLNMTGSFFDQQMVNRSGNYTGIITDDSLDHSEDYRNEFFSQTPFDQERVAAIGTPSNRNSTLMYNGAFELTDHIDLYSFGSINYRNEKIHAMYRFPYEEALVLDLLYPYGFSPELHADIFDKSLAAGLRGEINDWSLDFGYNHGHNTIQVSVFNSNNASLGIRSPISAFAGSYFYRHN
ncbi:MAG: TonB-dependent receptor plug domain-containing protein, partial [Reichenbachiella sp.]